MGRFQTPLRSDPSLRRRASAPLRQKPGLYLGVNLEQLQQKFGFKSTSKGREEKFNTKMVMPNCIVVLGDRRGVGPRTWRAVQGCTLRPGGLRRRPWRPCTGTACHGWESFRMGVSRTETGISCCLIVLVVGFTPRPPAPYVASLDGVQFQASVF